MRLHSLISNLNSIQVTGKVSDTEITGIEYDSRRIIKDSVFVAIKGFKLDGHNFILDAIDRGAIAVILENNEVIPEVIFDHSGIAKILVNDSREALAAASNLFYEEPSKKLNLIGITGTNGKTTTAFLLKNILEEAGSKVGLVGTIANYIGNEKIDSKLTTPEANDLNNMFLQMAESGCHNAVMEVSSHALALKRVHSITFKGAIFTNITPEHLDFHKNFENYLLAKKILFDSLSEDSFALYNADDIHSADIIKDSKAKKVSYGTSINSNFRMENISFGLHGTSVDVIYENNIYNLTTTLVGEFNAYNSCAAFAAALLSGIDVETALRGVRKAAQVPGRFEIFGNGKRKVIIDYSHTPDSLEKALMVIKKLSGDNKKIITVFGCGGNRDAHKRPIMGKIATNLSDEVIITSDNPRDEDPYFIIDQIKAGIDKNNYRIIENREDAIHDAIEKAGTNYVLLIAGKGHEDYQEIKGTRAHFSDREVAEKYFKI
jgi:UDP-N-acetylmuramoyl-L-alanyl-D-glutamate--2,6-diaminopimelate ligase